MAQKEQKKQDDDFGNTSKRNRHRNWFLTLNNYSQKDIDEILLESYSKLSMQEEKGKQGTAHLQGVIVFKNPKDFQALKKICGGRIHWEKCRSVKHAKKYCQKTETRFGKQWNYGWDSRVKCKVYDALEVHKPYDWQKDVIDLVQKEPDDRHVYWFWENKGCRGKSALAKHLALKYGGCKVEGARKDCYFSLAKKMEKCEEENFPKILIFDIPRCDQGNVNYHVIEDVKNGYIFSAKYESGDIFLPLMHVIIFANFPPDEEEKLSKDRWIVKHI